MGWQVLSPFRGCANHQFTGGYDLSATYRNVTSNDGHNHSEKKIIIITKWWGLSERGCHLKISYRREYHIKLFPLKLVSTVGFNPTHTCCSESVPKNCAAPYTILNLPVAHRQNGGVFIAEWTHNIRVALSYTTNAIEYLHPMERQQHFLKFFCTHWKTNS